MHLTVITPTYRRPSLLWHCLEQFQRQSQGGLMVEHLVVSDGPDANAQRIAASFPHVTYLELPKKSAAKGAGDAGRDAGIQQAKGEYVCFWNDDNVYYPHALVALYAAAQGVDIGVVQVRQERGEHAVTIPRRWDGRFRYADIDAACICVRTETARLETWNSAQDAASDIRWLERLERYQPTKRFVPIVIGVHL